MPPATAQLRSSKYDIQLQLFLKFHTATDTHDNSQTLLPPSVTLRNVPFNCSCSLQWTSKYTPTLLVELPSLQPNSQIPATASTVVLKRVAWFSDLLDSQRSSTPLSFSCRAPARIMNNSFFIFDGKRVPSYALSLVTTLLWLVTSACFLSHLFSQFNIQGLDTILQSLPAFHSSPDLHRTHRQLQCLAARLVIE